MLCCLQEETQSLTAQRDMLTWQVNQQRAIEAQEAERSLEKAWAATAQLQAHNAQLMDEREQLLQALLAARQQLQQQVRPTIQFQQKFYLTRCMNNDFYPVRLRAVHIFHPSGLHCSMSLASFACVAART